MEDIGIIEASGFVLMCVSMGAIFGTVGNWDPIIPTIVMMISFFIYILG